MKFSATPTVLQQNPATRPSTLEAGVAVHRDLSSIRPAGLGAESAANGPFHVEIPCKKRILSRETLQAKGRVISLMAGGKEVLQVCGTSQCMASWGIEYGHERRLSQYVMCRAVPRTDAHGRMSPLSWVRRRMTVRQSGHCIHYRRAPAFNIR